jgi:hypothetical protein
MKNIHPHAQFLVPSLRVDFSRSGLPLTEWVNGKRQSLWVQGALGHMSSDQAEAFASALTLIEEEG